MSQDIMSKRGVYYSQSHSPYRISRWGYVFVFSSKKKQEMFTQRSATNQLKLDKLIRKLNDMGVVFLTHPHVRKNVDLETYKGVEPQWQILKNHGNQTPKHVPM